MIDFSNAKYLKLHNVSNATYESSISPFLVPGEKIVATFQSLRDGLVFTTLRLITINVQGVTGKKKDFTSLPYNRIQAFSVETAGTFDLDSEMELWFSGMGRVKLEFTRSTDITALCALISNYALK